MKPVTDEELKEALKTEAWLNECTCHESPDTERHALIIRLALKRWIIDRREAKRKKTKGTP